MKITTWNKLWSFPAAETEKRLARSVSIHPNGRNNNHKRKIKEDKKRSA